MADFLETNCQKRRSQIAVKSTKKQKNNIQKAVIVV